MYYLVVHVAPLRNDSIACIKHTPRTCCVSVVPVCKWFSVLNRERERGNECVHVSKCLSPNRADFLCSGPNHIWNGKKAQEARKIAIITEHTQFVVFFFLFRIKRISIEILSTKHHLLFICIHGIEWRWLWMMVLLLLVLLLLLLLQRLLLTPNTNDMHKHTYCWSFFNVHQLTLIFCYVNFIILLLSERHTTLKPPHACTRTRTHPTIWKDEMEMENVQICKENEER